MPAATRISRARADRIRPHLEALLATPPEGPDPVDYVHRYTSSSDREVAALIAASLAFGRVASFGGTLDKMFALADRVGGPAAWSSAALSADDPDLSHSSTAGYAVLTYSDWCEPSDAFASSMAALRRS